MSIYDLKESHKKLFIGRQYPYYARKWSYTDDFGRRPSWNLSACFFSFIWLAYRRMYSYCALFTFLVVMWVFAAVVFALSAPVIIGVVLAFQLILGYFANNIYRYYMRTQLLELYQAGLEDDEIVSIIQHEASVSAAAAFVSFFMICAVFYLLALWANLLPNYLLPQSLWTILV